MHPDQLDIDLAVACDLIGEQFPRYRGESMERLGTLGTVNTIIRIGSVATARFPLQGSDPAAVEDSLRTEAAAMTELAASSPFPAPLPVGIGRPGQGYPMPWSVQTWLDGDVATPSGLAGSEAFATDLVTLISALRAVDVRGRTFDGQGRGGELTDHDEWMTICFAESDGLLDVPRLRAAWARLRELPRCGPAVMSHRDLIPANLLVRGEHLVGVLDGGGFGPADRALDLVAAWHLLDADRREIVRNGLAVGDLEWQRGAAWAFLQAMGLPWYYRHTNPGMAALGLSTLQRLLDDPVSQP